MERQKSVTLKAIFLILVVDVMSFGMIIPIVPGLIIEFLSCDLKLASHYGGLLLITYAIAQFVFSPILGNLSDCYGRRPILLISLAGFSLDYLLQAFSPTLLWLFVGRFISGIMGSSFATAAACIADVSEPEKRSQNFGIIGAAFGIGFTIGPLIGGFFGQYNLRLPFFVAAGITTLNFILAYFFIPESLSSAKRRKFEWKRANPFGAIYSVIRIPAMRGMIIACFFVYLAFHAVQSTWIYVFMEKFSWKEKMTGYSLAILGLLMGLVQGVLVRYTTKRLGNRRSVFIGQSLYAIGMLLFAFNMSGVLVFPIILLYCLGGIAGPAMQALLSLQTPANEQGNLQGLIAGLMGLASIIGPLIMTDLFFYFSHKPSDYYFPGAPFLLGAALMLASMGILYLNGRRRCNLRDNVMSKESAIKTAGNSVLEANI